jgi:hypothetical protein
MIKSIAPQEYLKGTAITIVNFFVKSMSRNLLNIDIGAFYVFVMSIFALPFGPHSNYVCGLMPLNIADLCIQLMKNP